MCFEDFNFVLNENEAVGGKKGSPSSNYLKVLMFEVVAIDLGFSGDKYTLGRKVNREMPQLKEDWTEELPTSRAYPKATISHLSAIGSDHTPIVLDTNPQACFADQPFRF